MRIEAARELKATLWESTAAAQGARPLLPCFVGVSLLGPGRYGVAVRYHDDDGAAVAERAVELAGDDVDARDVGEVRALSAGTGQRSRWAPEHLQRRARPLHPGLSIAHRDVSAGTLGAFVTVNGRLGVFALSNNHVLADSDRGRTGDAVLQPGPADGGTSQDHIGELAVTVPLSATEPNTVDAALALLSGVEGPDGVDATYPTGRITSWVEPDDEVPVAKVGRTTGLTSGRISAIELDDVTAQYPSGALTFDGQIEVTGASGSFSAGGDSGSLVYREDTGDAVGLLFAGSERGGPSGSGLTYCNPIGLALEALGARLLG